jgi:hypothetical protein
VRRIFHSVLIAFFILLLAVSTAFAAQIRSGDLILLPLDCYSCRMIAEETDSLYSHSGLLLQTNDGLWMVLESLGEVRQVSLYSFLQRLPVGSSARHLRFRELFNWQESDTNRWEQFLQIMPYIFKQQFEGLPFDHEYLWNNFTDDGEEKLYCSEFITKLLNHFLERPILPAPMDFSKHPAFWDRYFHGNTPQGKPGNSPADFADSKQLIDLGDLEI